MTHSGEQHRVRFDSRSIRNGGSLRPGFPARHRRRRHRRRALAELIVRDCGLLMVSRTHLQQGGVAEAHKRRSRMPPASCEGGWIDLSHVIEDAWSLIPAARGADLRLPQPRAVACTYAPGTEFQIGRIDIVATPAPISIVRSIASGWRRSPQVGRNLRRSDAIVIRADHREVQAIDAGVFVTANCAAALAGATGWMLTGRARVRRRPSVPDRGRRSIPARLRRQTVGIAR